MINISKNFPKLTLLILVLLGAAAIFLVGIYFYSLSLLEPAVKGKSEPVNIEIPGGASTETVSRILEKQGLIKNALAFRLFARYTGQDGSILAGEYELSAEMSVPEILEKVTSGDVVTYSFTVPEGYNLKQIADLLAEKGYADRDKFMKVVGGEQFDYEFLQGLPQGEKRLEGYLFPATYRIRKGTPEREIVDMMLKRFSQEITPKYLEKARAMGLNLHQAVTVASIIERETQKDAERPLVAAVLMNRMHKGMKLEIDATVQYALGVNKERLLNKDLKVDSPYNTYKIQGLPPGPIASPGRPSLRAAINPAAVDYLYYVVSQDGEHAFSKTYGEHIRNKRKYLERFNTP